MSSTRVVLYVNTLKDPQNVMPLKSAYFVLVLISFFLIVESNNITILF